MNKKGFTLIELLATIIILSIVFTVALTSIISFLKTSRERAEEVFMSETGSIIEDFIALNYSKFNFTSGKQCNSTSTDSNCVDAKNHKLDYVKDQPNNKKSGTLNAPVYYTTNYKDGKQITLKDLIDKKLTTAEDLVDPKDSSVCNPNTVITIYRDNQFVYYYRMKLNCCRNGKCNELTITDLEFEG